MARKLRQCILLNLAFDVEVKQGANGRFSVRYGKQLKEDLDYDEAAKEFGYCVFHALACDGKLDNGGS